MVSRPASPPDRVPLPVGRWWLGVNLVISRHNEAGVNCFMAVLQTEPRRVTRTDLDRRERAKRAALPRVHQPYRNMRWYGPWDRLGDAVVEFPLITVELGALLHITPRMTGSEASGLQCDRGGRARRPEDICWWGDLHFPLGAWWYPDFPPAIVEQRTRGGAQLWRPDPQKLAAVCAAPPPDWLLWVDAKGYQRAAPAGTDLPADARSVRQVPAHRVREERQTFDVGWYVLEETPEAYRQMREREAEQPGPSGPYVRAATVPYVYGGPRPCWESPSRFGTDLEARPKNEPWTTEENAETVVGPFRSHPEARHYAHHILPNRYYGIEHGYNGAHIHPHYDTEETEQQSTGAPDDDGYYDSYWDWPLVPAKQRRQRDDQWLRIWP